MTENHTPKAPAGLQARGRAFWRAVQRDLELEPHETQLLGECCRVLDRLEALEAEIKRSGLLTPDGRISPVVVEARLQAVALARLVASLRLPDEYRAEVLERGQRRGAARGPYRPRIVAKGA